jgi:GNAT superfamily N-acetyltransferase
MALQFGLLRTISADNRFSGNEAAFQAVRFLGADNENRAERASYGQDLRDIAVRALAPSDAAAFRAIALEALNRDGRYFTASLAEAASRSPSQWEDACAETAERAAFGGFVEDRLVGIMAARAWESDGLARSVSWGSAFVRPAHRRTGIGRYLYGTREQWSKQRGFGMAVFAIREDNARSTQIHVANGATCFATEIARYADGSEAATNWYRKPLRVSP